MREIRLARAKAGMKVESSKGEAWPGQHEINFRYADALKTADDHVIYKTGVKALAHQCGVSVTFMAKPDHHWVGSSCHIHSSLWRGRQGRVRRRVRPLQAVPRRPDRVRVGARDLLRADDQLVQAFRRRQLGADDARLGARQPDVRLPDRRPRLVAAPRDADSRRRRESVPRVRSAARRPGCTGSSSSSSSGRARGQRVRVRREALPAHAARGDRAARERHGRAAAARRRGRRPLPELRAHRAGALRPGGDELRARADVRAWTSKPIVGITTYVEPARGAPGSSTPRSIPYDYVQAVERAGARRAARAAERGRRWTRRSTPSTGCCFSGGSDLDPGRYGAEAHPETNGRPARARPRGACAARGGARARHARARGLPRLPGAERRARRRPRAAPSRGVGRRVAPRGAGHVLGAPGADRRRLAARRDAR